MISVRSGRGFGDGLYLQSVARHLVECGERVEVCSDYADLFRPLKGRVVVSPFRRERIDRIAHYIRRKGIAGSDQFRDCCISAGISEDVDLRLDWSASNAELVERVGASGRPAIVVQLPRAPMAREDGFGADLMPDCRVIQRIIDQVKPWAFVVQVGKGVPLFRFSGIDLDLANRTSVADVVDVASLSAGVLGYCSFIVPLAESLRKPALLVWSRSGLNSNVEFIRSIVPSKIIYRAATTRYVMDDCSDAELCEGVNAFREQVGMCGAV